MKTMFTFQGGGMMGPPGGPGAPGVPVGGVPVKRPVNGPGPGGHPMTGLNTNSIFSCFVFVKNH